jgi:hypothetical protein
MFVLAMIVVRFCMFKWLPGQRGRRGESLVPPRRCFGFYTERCACFMAYTERCACFMVYKLPGISLYLIVSILLFRFHVTSDRVDKLM